jgi:C1A family cysteine protease
VENGFITMVKDQQSSGNCWAFTAMAVLESCLKKATGMEFDLSEENMKNLIALYSDYGWKMDTNEGGYDSMPFGYFASWLGPVNESSDVFDDKSVLSPVLSSILHIQNILFLKRDNYTDNDAIKTAILKYGAVKKVSMIA